MYRCWSCDRTQLEIQRCGSIVAYPDRTRFRGYFRFGGDSGARRKCRACTKLNEHIGGDSRPKISINSQELFIKSYISFSWILQEAGLCFQWRSWRVTPGAEPL